MKKLIIAFLLVFVVLQTQAQQNGSTTRNPDTDKTYFSVSPGGTYPAMYSTALGGVKKVRISIPASDPFFEMWIDRLALCSQLETLELSGNKMEVLTSAFSKLTQLRTLYIVNNPDLHFDDAFQKLSVLPQLEALILKSNKLIFLPASLGNLAHLQMLDIDNSGTVDWNAAVPILKALPELHTLQIQVADVTGFPSCMAQVSSLQTIRVVVAGKDADTDAAPAYTDVFRVPVDNSRSLTIDLTVQDQPLSFTEEATLLHVIQQMKVRTQTPVYNNTSTSGFQRSYKGVNAPIPELDVKQATYAVDGAFGGDVVYNSGTVIRIPEDAFVDAAGNRVTGKVNIDYREFRNPLDFIVSGIPMTYDTAGNRENFESAGMFEINASVGGKEIFLAPDKKIDLAFSSTDAASSFNLYNYNAVSGKWDILSKAGKVEVNQNVKPQPYSEAWRRFIPAKIKISGVKDTVAFDERYASDNYFYTQRSNQKTNEKTSIVSQTRMQKLIVRIGTKNEKRVKYLVKFKRVSCREKDKTCFVLQYDYDKLPELRAFSNTVFVMDGRIPYRDFTARYGQKMGFSDIRIQLDGDQAMLELKSFKGFTNVNVTLAELNSKDSLDEIGTKNLASIRSYYNRTLNTRRKNITREINEQKKRNAYALDFNKKAGLKAWKLIQPAMSSEERALTYDQWLSYYMRLTAPGNSQPDVIRYLGISGFGIYNCDQVQRLEQPLTVNASFKDDNGLLQSAQTTYVIDGRMNGVLTFSGNNFSMDTKANTILILTLANGKLGYVTGNEVALARDSRNGNKLAFNIKTVNPEEISLEQLRTKLGI